MNNFFKIGIWYSIGQLLIKGVSFLLIPLYSRYLGTEVYGQLALVDIVYNFIGMFIIFSIYSGYIRFYNEDENYNGFATVFNFSLISIFIQGIIIFIFGKYFSYSLLKMENSYFILMLIFIRGSLEQIIGLLESDYSMKYQVKKLILLKFIITTINLLSIIYFVVVKEETIIGIYFGYIIGNLLVLFYIIYDNKEKIKLVFELIFFKKCFKFSSGILLGSISYLVLAAIDRYFLKEYRSFSDVGIYSMGYKFASLIEIFFIASFKKVFIPFKFQEYQNEDFEYKINKFFDYYNILGIIIFLLIAVNIKLVLYVFSTKEFLGAYLITPIITFSYLLYGQAEFYVIGIQIKNKTYIDSLIITTGGITNIILNIFWIKKYGMYGAAFSTIISYIVMSILYIYISQRLYYIKFNFNKMIKVILIGIISYFTYFIISIQNINIILETFIGNIIVLILVSIIYKIIFNKSEKDKVILFIKNKLKKVKK